MDTVVRARPDLWPACVVAMSVFQQPARVLDNAQLVRVTPGPLGLALAAGACPTVDDLVVAATVEIGIRFGVRVDALRILDVTPYMVVAGFRATALARPAGDPVWPLWTRGVVKAEEGLIASYGLRALEEGVGEMLRGRYNNAIALLQSVRDNLRLAEAREDFLLSKILAANIALAVSEAETSNPSFVRRGR